MNNLMDAVNVMEDVQSELVLPLAKHRGFRWRLYST